MSKLLPTRPDPWLMDAVHEAATKHPNVYTQESAIMVLWAEARGTGGGLAALDMLSESSHGTTGAWARNLLAVYGERVVAQAEADFARITGRPLPKAVAA